MPTPPRLYCIVWRSGGTDNFQWHRSLAMFKDEADKAHAGMIKAGHVAYVVDHAQSMSIGLPETYE